MKGCVLGCACRSCRHCCRDCGSVQAFPSMSLTSSPASPASRLELQTDRNTTVSQLLHESRSEINRSQQVKLGQILRCICEKQECISHSCFKLKKVKRVEARFKFFLGEGIK